jgi:hypothetical protein
MAMTTRSSISVNPRRDAGLVVRVARKRKRHLWNTLKN